MSKLVSIAEERGWEIRCKPGAKVERIHRRGPFEAFRRVTPLSPRLPDLPEMAHEVSADKIHELLGAIEEAKTILIARLQPPPAAPTQPKARPDRLLVSADEAARMLGLPRKTIYDLAKRKGRPEHLPPVRVLSRVMFRLEDVEAWVRKRVEAAGEPADVVVLRSR